MRAKIYDIIPGATLYYVFCVGGKNAHQARVKSKIIVTTNISTKNSIARPGFNCVEIDYLTNFVNNFNGYEFLNDVGIRESGEEPYNLHRLFTTEESAIMYVEECHNGIFSDPKDQAYYDKS